MSDRPFVLLSNKNVPQVQEPVADLGSLLTTVRSLKQGVENLGGYRGEMLGRAVTFNDLVGLGLMPPTTFNGTTGLAITGSSTLADLQAQLDALCPVRTYAGLPSSPAVGQEAVITDATANTWGASVISGGGGFTVRIWYNGVNWTVTGV